MCDHSKSVAELCNKLDHFGVVLLMWGANIPTIYYGFFCDHDLRMTYWMIVRGRPLRTRYNMFRIN